MQQIASLETKFEKCRDEEEAKHGELSALRIEYENKKALDHKDERDEDRQIEYKIEGRPSDNDNEMQYKRLSEELDRLRSELDYLKNRKKNIQIINDQVGGWCNRVGKKLFDQLQDHTLDNTKGGQSMIRQFKNISIVVHDQLSQICQQQEQAALEQEDDEDAMRTVNIKELINDFVTDEFEKKNIRVRPTSSLSTKEKKDDLTKQSTTLAN